MQEEEEEKGGCGGMGRQLLYQGLHHPRTGTPYFQEKTRKPTKNLLVKA